MNPRTLLRVALGVLLAVVLCTPAAQAADAHMTDAERQEVVDLLEESYAEFEALVADVDGEAWSDKPAEDRWSVGEVAEHLLLSEGALFGVIQKAMEAEPNEDWEAAAAKGLDPIVTQVPDRSQTFQAPEGLQPSGEMSREDTLKKFAEAREQTLEFVRTVDGPVKSHTQPNPLLGDANVPQWAAFIAAHNMRHNKQIAEVKEQLGE